VLNENDVKHVVTELCKKLLQYFVSRKYSAAKIIKYIFETKEKR